MPGFYSAHYYLFHEQEDRAPAAFPTWGPQLESFVTADESAQEEWLQHMRAAPPAVEEPSLSEAKGALGQRGSSKSNVKQGGKQPPAVPETEAVRVAGESRLVLAEGTRRVQQTRRQTDLEERLGALGAASVCAVQGVASQLSIAGSR